MDARRTLALMGAGLVGTAVAVTAMPGVAHAALAAPKSLAVARVADDPHKILISWPAVTGAAQYKVDIVDRDVDTVVTVPGDTTSYLLDDPDSCSSYKIRVAGADATGDGTFTGYYTLKSLAPGYVSGMLPTRESDGTVASVTWRTPPSPGYTPVTGYRVVLSKLSDSSVLADRVISDTSFRYEGIDPERAYNLTVTAENDFGACLTAKSLMDRYRPADPTNLVVTRNADNPGRVTLSWKAPGVTPNPTYYLVGYGQGKVTSTVKVDASSTSTVLDIDPTKEWILQIKAYNENGGSNALLGTVPVWDGQTTTVTAPTTSPAPAPTATPVPTTTVTAPAPTPPAQSGTGDKTPPTITATASPVAVNGWRRTPVTIHFTCTDADSGVASCPADLPVTTDGAGQKVTGTAYDKAGNSATTTVTLSIDQIAPVITASVAGDKNADGWYTGGATVHFTCSDAGSSTLLSCPPDEKVDEDGAGRKITGTAYDKAGNSATATVVLNLDRKAPGVLAKVRGTVSEDGWYRTDPTVGYTCTDSVSGVANCPTDKTVSAEGASQVLGGTATDKAGNTATAATTVNVDKTAPTITAAIVGATNADGWHDNAPVVHFTCADALSGVATCPADTQVNTDGPQQVSGTVVDKAGNTATASVTVSVDQDAPTITATVVGEPNAAGWFATPPTVHFTCADAGSGIVSCPADKVISTDGADQEVLGIAYDKAGNTAATTVKVNVDRTAPAITASIVGDASPDGWYRTAPTVHFTCTDATSGMANCPADIPVTAEGANQRVTGTGADKAGNPASAAITVNVDLTKPTVSTTVTGEASPDGWYRTAPTVHFTCADVLSGVAACPADQQVTKEGAGQSVTGSGTDKAGNADSAGAKVNVDLTAPVITATVIGEKSADGWYRSAPTVHFTCADTGSGVASCPADRTVTTDGTGQSISGTATDKAGNTANASVSVNVDLTAPAITATVVGDATADGWYRTAPTVQYTCTDNLSGVAACPAAEKVTAEGAGQTVTGTGTDKARNSATAGTKVNVDRTAPTVTVTGATDGAKFGPDAIPTVGCATADSGSGVGAKATATVTMDNHGGYTVTCVGGKDKAGNAANPVTIGYTVKPTVAWLKELTHKYLATANKGTLTELDNKLDHGQFALYSVKILAEAVSKKPTVTAANAAALMYWAAVLDWKN
ncbi:fibronectin type III domain-containing protein [Krasilnikovia sp. MM14-A1004]|uniref:fibronectin type III domain-containing protein n=1 Tax=Krasilnikovia sp. MM14-A1004 TaxID=3373541 RepID=UPI00399C89F7